MHIYLLLVQIMNFVLLGHQHKSTVCKNRKSRIWLYLGITKIIYNISRIKIDEQILLTFPISNKWK